MLRNKPINKKTNYTTRRAANIYTELYDYMTIIRSPSTGWPNLHGLSPKSTIFDLRAAENEPRSQCGEDEHDDHPYHLTAAADFFVFKS